MKKILLIIVLLVLALVGYKAFKPNKSATIATSEITTDTTTAQQMPANFDDFADIPPSYVDDSDSLVSNTASDSTSTNRSAPMTTTTPRFSCDGRQHCSQMRSCAEATYFIKHCPNTKMDGNNDGIPCEKQWCK